MKQKVRDVKKMLKNVVYQKLRYKSYSDACVVGCSLARCPCIMDVPKALKATEDSNSLTLGASLAATMAVTLVLVVAIIAALWALARKARVPHEAPGPYRWPVLGNLPHLRARVPYQALTALAKQFGPVYSLQLGSVPAVVVTGLDNIKQVLYHKLNHFDSRPNFNRYHQIFDGDKENCKSNFYFIYI